MNAAMKVWIDQELCTGDGQCADICRGIFFLHDDGDSYVSYVKQVGTSGVDADGAPTLRMASGVADVPRELEDAVIEAADFCPGACIFVERQ